MGKFDQLEPLSQREGVETNSIHIGICRASLVPTLAFGENDLYELYSATHASKTYQIQQFMKKMLGFTMPMFNGRGIFNCKYRRVTSFRSGRAKSHTNQGSIALLFSPDR